LTDLRSFFICDSSQNKILPDRTPQLPGFGVFEVSFVGGNPADDKSEISIQKAKTQNVIPDKFCHRINENLKISYRFSQTYQFFGSNCAEFVGLPDVLFDGVIAIMQNITFQKTNL
jgi:hypothetical protein